MNRLPRRLGEQPIEVHDPQEYGRQWRSLGEAVERHFPSYVVTGYDPFIRLQRRDVDSLRHLHGTYFDISVDAAIELTDWRADQ